MPSAEFGQIFKDLNAFGDTEYLMNRRRYDARERLKLCHRSIDLWSSRLVSLRRSSLCPS